MSSPHASRHDAAPDLEDHVLSSRMSSIASMVATFQATTLRPLLPHIPVSKQRARSNLWPSFSAPHKHCFSAPESTPDALEGFRWCPKRWEWGRKRSNHEVVIW